MIGHDNEEEEVHYKVADKRKFNADGSLREGVTLEPAKVEPKVEAKPEASVPTAEQTPPASGELHDDAVDDDETYIDEADGEEIPGARDPSSFVNFLSMLATNAATALGAVPNPATGQRHLDLETGKYWLDTIAMLRDKTNGNLHAKEAKLIDGLLADLRMQYVQLVRATEEKLKAQAAQQFSGSDILGKK
ncbi:hypothetical protein BH10ACI3_BH10ACI3_08920 [soil metagenome]